MKKSFYVLLVPLLFLMARCKEEEPFPVVTPVPQGYQEYFECRVNGTLWKPNIDDPAIGAFNDPLIVKYSPYYGLSVTAKNKIKGGLVALYTNGYSIFDPLPVHSEYAIDTVGTYKLAQSSFTYFRSIGDIDTTKLHYLKITRIDSALSFGVRKPVLEGNFEFTTVVAGTIDTIKITEGKFGLLW